MSRGWYWTIPTVQERPEGTAGALSPHRKAQEPGPGPISSTSNTDSAGLGGRRAQLASVKSTWRRTLTTADGTAVTGRCQEARGTAGAGEHVILGAGRLMEQLLWAGGAHTGQGNLHVLLHFQISYDYVLL